MTIIKNGEDFRIIDLLNQYDDLYFEGLNVSAHPYCNSLVIIDLSDAMKPGKSCTRWLFSVSPWKMDADRLCMTEYVEMAAPECDTLAELVAWLRAGKPLQEVDGLTVKTGAQASNRTFSPFAPVKPVKLGERLNASTIAKAIRAGQIVAGRTEGRYTDDYAADAAYDFYRGEIDLQAFAQDIYEHPSGWHFWWHDESRKEITAACHTFDYKRLAVAV
jgi:hypothetical protein